ncbi:helix-turn-helix transcriptional regulator [Marinactinospora thermotolerans]|uniref:helix-turn-helix transcriptional regulator n=1 Tax=Marinactinospora thermotolerans TaxID=531310 RepID=UPI003D8C7B90
MQLVERESELTILRSMLDEIGDRRGRIAVITGPPGSGKTRTLHAFAEAAVRSETVHLSASCLRNEQNLSLGVVYQIAQSLATSFDEPPWALRELREAMFNAGPDGVRVEDVNWIGITQGLWGAITQRTDNDTVLITVDDVQYADPISLEVLTHFVNRVHGARVLLVFTVTEGPSGLPLRIQAGLMHHPNCRRLRLTSYRPGMIAQLLEEVHGTGDEATAEWIHDVSNGNALLVHALVEDLHYAADPAGRATGEAFRGGVRTLLYRIGPAARQVIHAAAVLAPFVTPDLLARVLRVERADVAATLSWLESIGLLGAEGFRHPAARDAVLEAIEPDARRELNARAAQVLHGMGMQPTVVADRVLEGGPLQESWILDILCEAADQARAADEHEVTVRYLRHAVDLCTGERERVDLVVALAKAEWRVNPSATLVHLSRLLQAARDGLLGPADVYWLLTCMLWHGNEEEAASLYALLEADAGEEAAEWRATAEQWMSGTHPVLFHRLRGGYRAAPLQRRRGSPAALLPTGLRGEVTDAGAAAAERILQSARIDGVGVEVAESALFHLVYSDRLEEAATLSHALCERAARGSSPMWTSVTAAFHAFVAERRGDPATAIRYAERALTALPIRSLGVLAALPIATLVEACTWTGEHERAAEYLRIPLPAGVYRTRYGLHHLAARGCHQIAVGQPHAALSDLLECGALMRTWELDNPLLVPWALRAATAAVELGDRARAVRLLDRHRALPHGHTPRTKGMALMVLASTRELRQRPPLLREAVDLLQESGPDNELRQALTLLGRTLAELGENDKARLIGQQARGIGRRGTDGPSPEVPAVPAQAPTAGGGGEMGPARGARGLLSPAEHRVASLAALGYTNREISRKAHITVSTVEQHLTRIYRKLGIAGRNDLPLLFSTGTADTPGRAPLVVG